MGHGHDVRRGAARARLHVGLAAAAARAAWSAKPATVAERCRSPSRTSLGSTDRPRRPDRRHHRLPRLPPEALDAAMRALARPPRGDVGAGSGGRDARFTRFRGDGWQCLAPAPALALRAALFLRAHLRALDRDARHPRLGRHRPRQPARGRRSRGGDGPGLRDLRPRPRQDGRAPSSFAVAWAAPPPAGAGDRRDLRARRRDLPALDAAAGRGARRDLLARRRADRRRSPPSSASASRRSPSASAAAATGRCAGRSPRWRPRHDDNAARLSSELHPLKVVIPLTPCEAVSPLDPPLGAGRPAGARMLETAVALAFAHVLADFRCRPTRWCRAKARPRSCCCTSASSPASAGWRSASRSQPLLISLIAAQPLRDRLRSSCRLGAAASRPSPPTRRRMSP